MKPLKCPGIQGLSNLTWKGIELPLLKQYISATLRAAEMKGIKFIAFRCTITWLQDPSNFFSTVRGGR